jgi:hypothetical protein
MNKDFSVARHEATGNLQIGVVVVLERRRRRHGTLSLCVNTPLIKKLTPNTQEEFDLMTSKFQSPRWQEETIPLDPAARARFKCSNYIF